MSLVDPLVMEAVGRSHNRKSATELAMRLSGMEGEAKPAFLPGQSQHLHFLREIIEHQIILLYRFQ